MSRARSNTQCPNSALGGRTLDEAYAGIQDLFEAEFAERGRLRIVGADDTDIIACGRDDDDFRGGGFGDRPINSTLMAEIQEGRL
jgi:hypothetical protein